MQYIAEIILAVFFSLYGWLETGRLKRERKGTEKMSLVLGHRGASAYAPDNTRASFLMAIEMGADGVETDVHLTKDGVPVIQHNYDIDRNSNGHGNVEELTYDELLQFDFGSWKGEKYSGEKIMTLDECLEIAEKNMKFINLELKRAYHPENGDIAQITIDAVKKFGMIDRVLISSFDHALLGEVQEICPGILTGALYDEDEVKQNNIDAILANAPEYVESIGCDFAIPHVNYLLEDSIADRFAEKGIGVAVWTVDKPYIAKLCVRLGVKAIITNRPDRIIQSVDEECSK